MQFLPMSAHLFIFTCLANFNKQVICIVPCFLITLQWSKWLCNSCIKTMAVELNVSLFIQTETEKLKSQKLNLGGDLKFDYNTRNRHVKKKQDTRNFA